MRHGFPGPARDDASVNPSLQADTMFVLVVCSKATEDAGKAIEIPFRTAIASSGEGMPPHQNQHLYTDTPVSGEWLKRLATASVRERT